jgi:hypothetical protein
VDSDPDPNADLDPVPYPVLEKFTAGFLNKIFDQKLQLTYP